MATEASLERTAVSKIENGHRGLSVLELASVARVLELPLDWFVRDPLPAYTSMRGGIDVSRHPEAAELLHQLARDVEFLIELGTLRPEDPYLVDRRPASPQDAEKIAEDARAHVHSEAGPIFGLHELVQAFGLYAFVLETNGEGTEPFQGSYVALEQGGVTLVNAGLDTGRRRFTLVHELGHHIFRDPFSFDVDGSTEPIATGEGMEALIDAFAVNFLAPRASVQRVWDESGDEDPRRALLRLAVDFGLSWSAACAHAVNVDLLDEHDYHRQVRHIPDGAELRAAGLHILPALTAPVIPPDFEDAVAAAFRRNRITRERAKAMLRGSQVSKNLPSPSEIPLNALFRES